ncbi:MFS transporter [Gryllotalpicola koreensis]|uniref:MFS transporter n=1 Tax=Gryllotalpicola koreensis TaxID=993086 RepID=A0ABP7ZUJ5_9MICO
MSNAAQATAAGSQEAWRRAALVNARIDALPKFGLSLAGAFALLVLFFFANYDIGVFTITIPYIETQFHLQTTDLSWPVTANLLAYAVGAYLCGHIADRFGRRRGLLVTALLLGLGGLLTSLSWNLATFTIFRFVTGAGMGAVLALATAYLGELAPKAKRGRIISTIYLVQAIVLVAVNFASLPVLQIGTGWRFLLAFGALVIFVPFAFRDKAMMESPRWLAEKGNLDEAERLVGLIEARLRVQGPPPEIPPAPDLNEARTELPIRELLRRPLLGRVLVVVVFWFAYYVAFYGFSSYRAIILGGLGVTVSNAIFITVLSTITGPIACIVLMLLIERMERRTIVIIGCALQVVSLILLMSGLGIVAFTAANLIYSFMVSIVTPPAFTYSAEMFPTRARGTATAIGDGMGHIGGAVAPFIVLPILASAGAGWTVIVVAIGVAIAAVSLFFGPRTKERALTEIAS